ncbi:unnamed protein product [Prorocentrum cordatum]|uniref:Uncharacterized protein n=1 Tax=Prorocentrum cordatum TaxID=2364126 RepID=A0ABN9T232_9DINO|nr:unnamed protein product [Polarella glacialis]
MAQEADQQAAALAEQRGSQLDAGCVSVRPPASGTCELGPPLECLPQYVDFEQLQAFRYQYRGWRTGKAEGARGEVDAADRDWYSERVTPSSASGSCQSEVQCSFTFSSLDRRKLEADPWVRRSFLDKLQQALEAQVGPLLQSEHVWLLLSAVSVVVYVHLRPPLGTSVDEVMALLAEPARLAREAAGHVASVEGIEAVAIDQAPGCDLRGTNTIQVSKPRVVPRAVTLRCSQMPKGQHRRRDGLCCGCGYMVKPVGAAGAACSSVSWHASLATLRARGGSRTSAGCSSRSPTASRQAFRGC